jgi:hypothetical protein
MMTLEVADYIAGEILAHKEWLRMVVGEVQRVDRECLHEQAFQWAEATADDAEPLGRTPEDHCVTQMFVARSRGIDPQRVLEVFLGWCAMPPANRPKINVQAMATGA